jgi:hypothetical protein
MHGLSGFVKFHPLELMLIPWQSLDDTFSVSHPVFLWMFRITRNWDGVAKLLPGMRNHVHSAGLKRRLGSKFEGSLVNDHGTPIEDYSLIFRELFCVAADDLAHDLHEPLNKMGILYDEITVTGEQAMKEKKKDPRSDLDIEGLSGGNGKLLFLLRTVNRRDAEHLQTAGYCFAEPLNVIPHLATTLKVGPKLLSQRFEIMCEYVKEERMSDPGVHLAIFAIRASLGAGRHGFDVLARKDAKNQLPTMQFPFDDLNDFQLEYLKTMDSMTMSAIMKKLVEALRRSTSEKEKHFAKQLFDTIEAIKEESQDPIFDDAKLIADPIRAPCRGVSEDSPPGVATFITFRIVVPIHSRAPGRKLKYTPLNFFKMQQQLHKNAAAHDVFAREVHREFANVLDLEDLDAKVGPAFAPDPFNNGQINKIEGENTGVRRATAASQRRPSRARVEKSSEANLVDANSHDDEPTLGIVNYAGGAGGKKISSTSPRTSRNQGEQGAGLELSQGGRKTRNGVVEKKPKEEDTQTYIDEMFAITIAKR